AGLRPILEYEHSDDVERDRAIGTDPAHGTVMQRYDEITLNISLGPDEIEIPESLRGASEATVRDTLEGLGLTVSEVSYVNSATIPRDRLVDTNPALGSTVSFGSTIALKMSSGEVEVPNVLDMSREDAESTLTGEAIGLGFHAEEVETSNPDEVGVVFWQSHAAGESVGQGTQITVHIGIPEPEPEPEPEPTEEPSDDPTGEPTQDSEEEPTREPERGPRDRGE